MRYGDLIISGRKKRRKAYLIEQEQAACIRLGLRSGLHGHFVERLQLMLLSHVRTPTQVGWL